MSTVAPWSKVPLADWYMCNAIELTRMIGGFHSGARGTISAFTLGTRSLRRHLFTVHREPDGDADSVVEKESIDVKDQAEHLEMKDEPERSVDSQV